MNEFQKFVFEMPYGMADEFRKKVVKECGVTEGLFRLWRSGFPVKKQENREAIDRIATEMFGRKVFTDQV